MRASEVEWLAKNRSTLLVRYLSSLVACGPFMSSFEPKADCYCEQSRGESIILQARARQLAIDNPQSMQQTCSRRPTDCGASEPEVAALSLHYTRRRRCCVHEMIERYAASRRPLVVGAPGAPIESCQMRAARPGGPIKAPFAAAPAPWLGPRGDTGNKVKSLKNCTGQASRPGRAPATPTSSSWPL